MIINYIDTTVTAVYCGALLSATSQGGGCHVVLPYVIVPLPYICWFHAGFKGVCLGMLESEYLSVSVTW